MGAGTRALPWEQRSPLLLATLSPTTSGMLLIRLGMPRYQKLSQNKAQASGQARWSKGGTETRGDSQLGML